MQHIFITNGTTQLILMPENDLDKVLLEALTDGRVEVEKITQQVSVLGKSVKDGLLIKCKTPNEKIFLKEETQTQGA